MTGRKSIMVIPLPERIRSREADGSAAFTYRGNIDLMTHREAVELAVGYSSRPQARKVSIVMAVYNRADTVATAVQSVIDQSYNNWELLIVDDGSTDDTQSVIRPYLGDERIGYVRIPHAGVSVAQNKAIRRATGVIIAYIGSDDEWHPDYLLLSVNHMLDAGRKCNYSAIAEYDLDKGEGLIRCDRYERLKLLTDNFIGTGIFIHARDLVDELGMFDESLGRWVDWDLILRYTQRYEPSMLPAVLYYSYRKRSLASVTDTHSKIYKNRVIDKHDAEWRLLLGESGKPFLVRWWILFDRWLRYHKRVVEHRLLQLLARTTGNGQ
jgi:glycosyltransferase involved in cell wall biosynthesis